MSFPKYPAYKDSGVQWLGEVPSHWSVGRLKHLLRIRGGQDYKAVESAEPTEFPVIGSGGPFSYATDYLYSGESVLLGRKGTIDKPLYVRGEFWTVDTMFYTEVLPETNGRYAYHLATTIPFGLYSTNTALPSMSQFDLANHEFPLPGLKEQTQIARFLDHETAKIDALIREQERLIELLQEKRQAVISHAVTKGLDPDVPMKDSGVEWLGEVPEHWNICPIKFFVSTPVTDGPHETPEFLDEGTPFISAEAVSQGEINFSKAKFISPNDHSRYSRKYKPKLHDIFMVKSGATTGTVAINESDTEFNIWSPLAVIRCSDIADPHFILHAMRSQNFQESIVLSWSFGTQQNIGMGVIENLPIALPPLQEQLRIKNYLNEIGATWCSLELEARKAINLLKERRSALISAAVTGKIDVRNWQPPADESAFDKEVRQAGIEVVA